MTVGLPSISATVPALSHVERLFSRIMNPQEQEDFLLTQAAEKQVGQEKEAESFVWDVLNFIGRPQHAVAGVIYDLINGGDFSPLDRVNRALMGEESYGMRHVLDRLLPGKWSQLKMPDWMPIWGNKTVDPLKGTTAFLGDVISDPLMHTRLFSSVGQLAKIGAQERTFVTQFLQKAGPRGSLESAKLRAAAKELEHEAAATSLAFGTALDLKSRTTEMAHLFRNIIEKPEIYKRWLGEDAGARVWFDEAIESFKGNKFSTGSVAQDFIEGHRSAGVLRLNLLGKSIGIPDINMVPQIANKYIGAAIKGMDQFMTQTGASKVMREFGNIWKRMFVTSTGIPEFDYAIHSIGSQKTNYMSWARQAMRDIVDQVGPRYADEKYRKHLVEGVMAPLGQFARATRYHLPDDVMDVAESIREYLYEAAEKGMDIGSLKQLISSTGRATSKEAWKRAQRQMQKAGFLQYVRGPKGYRELLERVRSKYPNPRKFKKSETEMEDFAIVWEKGDPKVLDPRLLYKLRDDYFDELTRYDMMMANTMLDDTHLFFDQHYLPREFAKNPEWIKLFEEAIKNEKIVYKGAQAWKTYTDHGMHRFFREKSHIEYNKLAEAGSDEVLGHDFFDKVIKDMFRHFKTRKEKNLLYRMFHNKPEIFKLYNDDDPVGLIHNYLMSQIESWTRRGRVLAGLKSVALPVLTKNDMLYMSEKRVILNPQVMKEILGADWKDKLTPTQRGVYEQYVKENLLATKENPANEFFAVANEKHVENFIMNGLPVFSVPNGAVDEINRALKTFEAPESFRKFLAGYDAITDLWKGLTLAPFPGYHARNVVGGFWQMFLGGTMGVRNLKDGQDILHSIGHYKETALFNAPQKAFPKARLADIMITDTIDANEGYRLARKFNLFQGIYTPGTEFKEMAVRTIQPFWMNAGGQIYKHTIRRGFRAGQMIEDWQRFSHFVGELRNGKSAWDAAMSVKKYFFDYSDLTQFEKMFLRRIMPFYSWSRFNIPLQVRASIEQPHKFAQLGRAIEWMQSDEGKNFDRNQLPKWVSEQFGVPTKINSKTGNIEVLLLRSWIPAADLMAIAHTRPTHALMRHGLTLLHPIPKTLLEFAQNRSQFTEMPMEEFPGEPGMFLGKPLRKRNIQLLKNFRILSEIDRLFYQKGRDVALDEWTKRWNVVGFFPKVKGFDPVSLEKRMQLDIRIRKGILERKFKKAKRDGDIPLTEMYRSLIEDVTPSKSR